MVCFGVLGGVLYYDITKRYKHISKEEGIQNRFVSETLTQIDKAPSADQPLCYENFQTNVLLYTVLR